MASPSISTALSPPVYGQVTVDGLSYIERPQIFVLDVQIDTQFQVLTGQRLTLPGIADFLLKGLSRDMTGQPWPTPPGPPGPTPPGFTPPWWDRIFRFRIVNAEGTTWFFTGGLGIFDDRVFSPLCFGSGQFPFPLIPPVPVHANGSLIYEVEDIGPSTPGPPYYPYTIHMAFHGAYLIPATGAGAGQGPLAFGGATNGTVSNTYNL